MLINGYAYLKWINLQTGSLYALRFPKSFFCVKCHVVYVLLAI